ncbi:ankyrin [Lophiostoma macrostomum CBS 122681]|uniref:Ankyrin n=1 Tax=Lophiostoma macrostomum CBS 122681 TaxID=1314788 RepID=A0A6A6TS28_9PLEO|nr:ankyrin [Lophiostoma macrostomum CBS 122681]
MEATLAVVGLLAAFKGAVDSYVTIERFFSRDSGLQDRALHFERIRKRLEQWGAEFGLDNSQSNEERLLYYESKENQEMIQQILKRTTRHVEEAQRLFEKHQQEKAAKKSGWPRRPFGSSKDGSKNRASWILKDQEQVDAILKQLNEHLENLAQYTIPISGMKNERWKSSVQILTSVDEKRSHTDARNKRLEGTCQWLFHREEYLVWLSGKTNNLLWVHGTPGNGKTVLASAIIDRLAETSPDKNIALAYFYCNYKDPARQSLSELFGSLLAQLTQQTLIFRHPVWEYLASLQKSYRNTRTIDYAKLAKILLQTCKKLECTYLVIDAADEFLPPSDQRSDDDWVQRKALLETLLMLQREGKGKVKILLTSRPTAQIQSSLKAVPRIMISTNANSEDIRYYVRSKLEREMENQTDLGVELTRGEMKSPTVKSLIVTRLVEKAEGMFLFASLQLQILQDYDGGRDILTAVGLLPSDINKTWELLLRNIDAAQQFEEGPEIVKKILQWLAAAARPLKLCEVRAAVAVGTLQTRVSIGDNLSEAAWLCRLCGPLVRLTSDENPDARELSLAHFSLKEFLVSGKLRQSEHATVHKYDVVPSDTNAYLAAVSLTYLSSEELSQPYHSRQELEALRQNYKLLDYVTVYGGVHLLSLDRADETIIELLSCLLIPEVTWGMLGHAGRNTMLDVTFTAYPAPNLEDNSLASWPANYKIEGPQGLEISDKNAAMQLAKETLRAIQTRRNCKLFLQLFRILSDPMRKDHPVNVTPLYYASLFGWTQGVQRLLQMTSDRATKSDLNHALRAAAVGGFQDIIDLLCNAGANVNVHMGSLGSPLGSATSCGHNRVVRKLLDMGVDPQKDLPYFRPGGTVGSSLQGAAEAGDTAMMQLLIDWGADLNCNDGWLGTALQSVLEKVKHDVAKWILDHPKFDPHVTGGYYGSASRILCIQDWQITTDFLETIFRRGGSPSERVGPYGSLLEISSHFGHMSKVELLLKWKAELDGTSMGQFGNAVHATAMHGDENVLRLLLDHGGDPNCPGHWLGDSATEFQFHEYGDCVWMRQGTGFLAYDHSWVTKGFFAPAIHAAMRLREIEHNKIFVLFSNEPTQRHAHLGNPLQGAAFRGNVGAMKLLLSRGARIHAKGGFFGTALQAAASQNHLEAVKTLLESGADPNVTGVGYYGSALAAATALGFNEIIQALANKGARDDCFDDDGWGARTWQRLLLPDQHSWTELENECKAPSAWSITNRSPKMNIDNDGLGVRFAGDLLSWPGNPLMLKFSAAATVLANHPIPPYANFYFEITVENQGNTGYVYTYIFDMIQAQTPFHFTH